MLFQAPPGRWGRNSWAISPDAERARRTVCGAFPSASHCQTSPRKLWRGTKTRGFLRSKAPRTFVPRPPAAVAAGACQSFCSARWTLPSLWPTRRIRWPMPRSAGGALCVHFDTTPFGFKCQKPVQLCKVLTNIAPTVKCNNINYVSICD